MTERDHLDHRLAAGLEQHLTAQIQHDTRPSSRQPATPTPHRRTLVVTAAVGLLVVLLTVVALHAVNTRTTGTLPATTRTAPPASSTTPTTTPTSAPVLGTAALIKQLPKPDYGRLLHTWTEQDTTSTGPFTTDGDTVVISGICNGGGAVSLTDVTGKPHTLSCHGLRTQQPFWRFNLGGDEQPTATTKPFRITVRILKGNPHFVVRLWAVDPRVLRSGWFIATSSQDVPRTLRTCTAKDLATTGTLKPLDASDRIVTITNRSATDCAIRSWPTLNYLDQAGHRIGAPAGMSLDSREGAENRYHELPPARLAARGGHGYFIVTLPAKARLERDDRNQAESLATATPQPTPYPTPDPCQPVQVRALQTVVAGTTITVPVPDKPAVATCQNPNVSYGGVNPVVSTKPTAE